VRPLVLLLLAIALAAAPVRAHHRKTPPVVAFTTTGEATLPRLAPPSRAAAAFVVDDTVAVVNPFRTPTVAVFTFTAGTNASPSISKNGRTVAWDTDADPLASGAPGRQVVRQNPFGLAQAAIDPSGTSANAAVDAYGLYTAFESTADLAATGNAGARQVFLRHPDGTLTQLSRGSGTSGNPSLGIKARMVVFDSTSDPVTGDDTGTAQVWVADLLAGATEPITAGAGPSYRPSLSNDGRAVVFESRADLAGDGHDTGVPQVFAWDRYTKQFARVTDDAGGCTNRRPRASARPADRLRAAASRTSRCCRQTSAIASRRTAAEAVRLVPKGDAYFDCWSRRTPTCSTRAGRRRTGSLHDQPVRAAARGRFRARSSSSRSRWRASRRKPGDLPAKSPSPSPATSSARAVSITSVRSWPTKPTVGTAAASGVVASTSSARAACGSARSEDDEAHAARCRRGVSTSRTPRDRDPEWLRGLADLRRRAGRARRRAPWGSPSRTTAREQPVARRPPDR
jgi:hypothetical protein